MEKGGKRNGERTKKGKGKRTKKGKGEEKGKKGFCVAFVVVVVCLFRLSASKRKKATTDNRKHASEKEKRNGKGERQKIGLR